MSEGGPRRHSAGKRRPAAVEVVRRGKVWDAGQISDAVVERAAQAAFDAASPQTPAEEVTILLTGDTEMRELNRNWRGKDAPTNVLSFVADDATQPGFLGDIAIAYETAAEEAQTADISLADHVSHLVIHGVLHLLGFDHMDDAEAERMEQLERRALASLGIADPYAREEQASPAEVSS